MSKRLLFILTIVLVAMGDFTFYNLGKRNADRWWQAHPKIEVVKGEYRVLIALSNYPSAFECSIVPPTPGETK